MASSMVKKIAGTKKSNFPQARPEALYRADFQGYVVKSKLNHLKGKCPKGKNMKRNNSKSAISTKLVYLDLSVVLANYRDPSFWGKQWTIYKRGPVEIYWMMTEIDVRNGTISSEVHMRSFLYRKGKYKRQWHDNDWTNPCGVCRRIPVANPEYSQEVFESNIFAATMSLIKSVEQHLIRGYSEYQAAAQLDDEYEDSLEEIAEGIADKYVTEGPYSDDIKDAFIVSYQTHHSSHYALDVLSSYDHKVIGSLYLMICSWFNKEKEFQEHKKLMGDNKKTHIWTEMWAKAKEIQTEEWHNAMAKELEASLQQK